MSETLTITVSDDQTQETIENALRAVEAELDVDVHRQRGRPAAEEITMADAVGEMAAAYDGIDAGNGRASDA